MAELRLLTARQLRQVYRERVRSDFPPSERRPLASMERLRAAGVYDTWGMYEGEELLAYAFLWRSEAYGVALLDYLAVCREGRGRRERMRKVCTMPRVMASRPPRRSRSVICNPFFRGYSTTSPPAAPGLGLV